MPQQTKLGRTEGDLMAAPAHAVPRDIHFDIGEGELFAGERRSYAAKHGARTRNQLARAKRLGHIVVRARLEAADAISFLAARGQHHDRHIGSRRATAEPPADLNAADALDHPIE